MVQHLADAGAQIVVLDLIKPAEARAFLHCDITSKSEVFACRDDIMKQFGRVDILLNGAGTNAPTSFFKISEAEIQRKRLRNCN